MPCQKKKIQLIGARKNDAFGDDYANFVWT